MNRWRFLGCFWAVMTAASQEPQASVDEMLRQARKEIATFEKAGGKKNDPQHPVAQWTEGLWKRREASPGTPDAAKAASESVHLLIHADRFAEAQARADQIPPEDPAWQSLPQVLFESASLQKNFAYFFDKLQAVLSGAKDATTRAAVQLSLGRGWREQHDEAKARVAFQAAMDLAGKSAAGKQAETELYEVLHLGVGQPAPAFSATAVNGSRVSLADYRGKPLVLVFWATH